MAEQFTEWIDKPLYDKIDFLWSGLDSGYNRRNKALETIIEFFRPDMDTDSDSQHDMDLLGHSIYEGTGPWAAKTKAIGFQSHQFSKAIDWISYKMRSWQLQDIDELDQYCNDARDHMTQVYQRGNFYDVQPMFSLNAITLGSPVLFSEEDIKTGEIFWTPQHYKTYRLFYDRYNRPNGIIVEDYWTAKQIYDRFCKGRTKEERIGKLSRLQNSTVESLKSGNFSEKILIRRACFKWDDPVWYGTKGLPMGGHEWIDCYFEKDPNDKEKPLEISGFFKKPFVVWDYDKKPWETASRTDAFSCVYDNLALNQIFKNYMDNTQLYTRPPMMSIEEHKGRLSRDPGDIIYLDKSLWDYRPELLDQTNNPQLEEQQAKIFEDKVKRHFNIDLFDILSQNALMRGKPLTATQILGINQEKITLISPMLESNDNYLEQVDERCLDIEKRAGRGPFSKDNMEYIADVVRFYAERRGIAATPDVKPEFVGRLRRAQQMQQRLEPLRMGLAFVKEVEETLDPDAALAVRTYDVIDDGLQATNFPMKNLKPREEYEQERAQLMEARANQQMIENQIEAMKALPKGSTPMIEGQTA